MRQNIRSNYIGDLRAFAILLVIFHHAKEVGNALGIPYTKEFYTYVGRSRGVDLFLLIPVLLLLKAYCRKCSI